MKENEIDIGPYDGELVTLLVGHSPKVIIDKLYGPTGGNLIKVELDMHCFQWVISQHLQISEPETDYAYVWVERARIDLQPMDDVFYKSLTADPESEGVE